MLYPWKLFRGAILTNICLRAQLLIGGEEFVKSPKFNIPSLKLTAKAPENWWLEDEFPFGMTYFQGLC